MNRISLRLLACILVLAAACGGGAVGDDTTTTTGEAPDTTAADQQTTTSTVSDADDDEGAAGGDFGGVCLDATQAMAAAAASVSAAMPGAGGAATSPEDLELVGEQLQAMADAAPAEIQDDLRVLAEELGEFYEAMADIDFEPGSVPTEEQIAELERIGESMDTEALETATDNLDAWFEENC